MASSIGCGRVRTTTTVESRKMTAKLHLKVESDMLPCFTAYFFDIRDPSYCQLTNVKTRYPLTSVTLLKA